MQKSSKIKLLNPGKKELNGPKIAQVFLAQFQNIPIFVHGEIIYGGTRLIEDDCSATFSEYIFLFPACLMISHWLTKNAELNSVF